MSTDERSLYIIGGGDLAREIIWIAECLPGWKVGGVLTDLGEGAYDGYAVKGVPADWQQFPEAYFVLGVGCPRTRKMLVNQMQETGAPRFATLVHPSVQMSEHNQLGDGVVIAAGSVLTTGIEIGDHALLNLGVRIGHDVRIGAYCNLSPSTTLSGRVELNDGVEMGTGAIVVPGIQIGEGAMVGAGAVVTKPPEANHLVAGIPARRVRELEAF